MADGIVLFSAAKTYFLIGDIHSDCTALKRVFKTTGFFETLKDENPSYLIFMGDYVDRGKAHLKTMETLLIMKALFPDRITLLRGNHDGGTTRPQQSVRISCGVILKEMEKTYY